MAAQAVAVVASAAVPPAMADVAGEEAIYTTRDSDIGSNKGGSDSAYAGDSDSAGGPSYPNS